jgi:hypothetical protein
MQDEVNEKVVALAINTGKKSARLTENVLKHAIRKFLKEIHESGSGIKHGRQTVSELMRQNTGLTNLEITDENIKSFQKIAGKYNIDFALKKDMNRDPPRYLVFFKARDADVMEMAFKEYSSKEIDRSEKPSIEKKLNHEFEKIRNEREHKKVRVNDRGIER